MGARRNRVVCLKNLLKNYGPERVSAMLQMFEMNLSLSQVGAEFGVTKECARQWRNALGVTIYQYQVHPDIVRISRE